VTVDTENAYFIVGHACSWRSVIRWWFVGRVWLAISTESAIAHDWNVVQTPMISASPVILEFATTACIGAVKNPLV